MASVVIDGAKKDLTPNAKAIEFYLDAKEIVVAEINGVLMDLATILNDGDVVVGVPITSDKGLAVLRHSTAHVLAQAVQQNFLEAKLGIGPPIRDGFYYDFDVARPFTPDDLKTLEKSMEKIIRAAQRFSRRVVTESDALKELASEPYKCELVGIKGPGEMTNVGVTGSARSDPAGPGPPLQVIRMRPRPTRGFFARS